MITLIVPTRNRAHTLELVAPSYFEQERVTELIFVDDAGTDNTAELITQLARNHPEKRALVLRNQTRQGASMSRNIGVLASKNEFILFCDDDEYLEAGYASTCLAKLNLNSSGTDGAMVAIGGVGAVSGRRVYMRSGETPEQALLRFGIGMRRSPPFRHVLCEYVNGARYQGDIELPFTNAIILTTKSLLLRFPFDGFYARGNGYREETDFQMNLFVHGFRILATNECHSIHLPLEQVRSGGQRTAGFKRVYWSIYYTAYFFRKYYAAYSEKSGVRTPRLIALLLFAIFAIYRETLRPPLYSLWVRISSLKTYASSLATRD